MKTRRELFGIAASGVAAIAVGAPAVVSSPGIEHFATLPTKFTASSLVMAGSNIYAMAGNETFCIDEYGNVRKI